jgi:hypothetical protein
MTSARLAFVALPHNTQLQRTVTWHFHCAQRRVGHVVARPPNCGVRRQLMRHAFFKQRFQLEVVS